MVVMNLAGVLVISQFSTKIMGAILAQVCIFLVKHREYHKKTKKQDNEEIMEDHKLLKIC